MAEIKSTLDIIMEKAKGFTATDEEKAQFKRKELEERVAKYLHKTLSGALDLERLSNQMDAFDKADSKAALDILQKQCLDALNPEGDNRPVLEILKKVVKRDTTPVKSILSDFRETLEKGKSDLEVKLKRDLEKAGISGSAVFPNVLASPDWQGQVAALKEKFFVALESIRDELMNT